MGEGLVAIGSYLAELSAGEYLAYAAIAASAYSASQASTPAAQTAQPIDKSTLQKEAEVGKLQLGEEAEARKNRAKGKGAFKIDLPSGSEGVDTGVQAPSQKDVGVQL